MDQVKESSQTEPLDFSTIIVAIIVLLITIVIFIFLQKRRSSRRSVLLTGLCDSGKTLLFSQLVHNKYVGTHSSMKENVGDILINKGSLRLIDIPGYERLRQKFVENYMRSSCGIIYLVDSVTIQKDIRDVAEYLYNIIAEAINNRVQCLLIVCNKQDLAMAKTSVVVKSLLKRELNALRITKASQLQAVDSNNAKIAVLGKKDVDFSFSNLPVKVEFVEASAVGESSERVTINRWLQTLC